MKAVPADAVAGVKVTMPVALAVAVPMAAPPVTTGATVVGSILAAGVSFRSTLIATGAAPIVVAVSFAATGAAGGVTTLTVAVAFPPRLEFTEMVSGGMVFNGSVYCNVP